MLGSSGHRGDVPQLATRRAQYSPASPDAGAMLDKAHMGYAEPGCIVPSGQTEAALLS